MHRLSQRLRELSPACRAMGESVDAEINRLANWSTAFSRLLERFPQYWVWLEAVKGYGGVGLDFGVFYESRWKESVQGIDLENKTVFYNELRKFRKKMSLWIAYCDVNERVDLEGTLIALTRLAEYCLNKLYTFTYTSFVARFGIPYIEESGRQATFCTLAMGKFGSEELNFCSDIDIVFLYDGEGACRRDGRKTGLDNREFFLRMAREIVSAIQEASEYGTLYNVDLRLRPDGEGGPLVRSVESAVNYYWSVGQTWERLMLAKARVVCGDVDTGEEFIEAITPFRYPRHSLPNLPEEVAGMKFRIEKEVLGEEKLLRDIKNGWGGIREIEYICQSLQCLHGARNPFLQVRDTVVALGILARYEHITTQEAVILTQAWDLFRTVENRLQMREDSRTHLLPADSETLEALAVSLNVQGGGAVLLKELEGHRGAVRRLYLKYLPYSNREFEIQNWSLFFGGAEPTAEIAEKIHFWFPHAENAVARLRLFVVDTRAFSLLRESVLRFLELAKTFDTILPSLARPMQTLERVAAFAKRYKARVAFMKTCVEHPELFRTLCLLFDHSVFIFELLHAHPEIIEELLAVSRVREKSFGETLAEIHQLPLGDDFERYLWLYVRAEQVRIAIAQLLHHQSISDTETALTTLADAVIQSALERVDAEGKLCVIALGKYGGGELSFGSDLDFILLGSQQALSSAIALTRLLGKPVGNSKIYELDLRLRPHGDDGPLVVSLEALERYHATGQAQLWERQMLTRARFVAGNANIAQSFKTWRTKLLYSRSMTDKERQEIWKMRERIVEEKTEQEMSDSYFKVGIGGILDIEFLAQTLQLSEGYLRPKLRTSRTRRVLQNFWKQGNSGYVQMQYIREHYEYLRTLELYLRRYRNTSVDTLPEDADDIRSLAHWMGQKVGFIQEHRVRMKKCRKEIQDFLEECFKLYIS